MKKELTREYRLILDCLSKVLFDKDFLMETKDIDFKKLFDEAIKQSVFPIVYHCLKPYVLEQYVSKLDFNNTIIVSNNVIVECEHNELHRVLDGIPYVVLKGVASARYYREPGLRTMGDVDFLIEKSNINRVEGIVIDSGFEKKENKEHSSHIAFHRYPHSVWEMHWSMSGIPTGMSGDAVRNYFATTIDTSKEVVVSGFKCMVPDDFHHGLILLIHNARHIINTGIGLRHICDWAVFVDSIQDFEAVFKDKLEDCGLYRFAQILTQLSTKYLGLKEQTWAEGTVDDYVIDNLILDIFDGGNFGIKNKSRINQAKLMTDSGIGTVSSKPKWIQLFRTLSEKSRVALPFCQKSSLLLPVGWVYVVVRHTIRIICGKRPGIHIRNTIEGANVRSAIYREFKLFEQKV